MSETFSFYALRADDSVAAWDMLRFDDEAAAGDHAIEMVALYPDATAVEVWGITRCCFSVPAAPHRRADKVTP